MIHLFGTEQEFATHTGVPLSPMSSQPCDFFGIDSQSGLTEGGQVSLHRSSAFARERAFVRVYLGLFMNSGIAARGDVDPALRGCKE